MKQIIGILIMKEGGGLMKDKSNILNTVQVGVFIEMIDMRKNILMKMSI